MSAKTHKTAVVVIPPEPAWEPIQAIRRRHDRQRRRWMPHVTLLHPFRPRPMFDTVAPALAGACRRAGPFRTTCFGSIATSRSAAPRRCGTGRLRRGERAEDAP